MLGAEIVFTLVTAAQTLGFGTSPAGVASLTASTSLLADLSARYFGSSSGDVLEALAIACALGGALAAIVAASRILFALCRDLVPSSAVGKVSEVSGTPRNAAFCVLVAAIIGYAVMRTVFHATGQDAFFLGLDARRPRPPDCLSARGRECGGGYHSVRLLLPLGGCC